MGRCLHTLNESFAIASVAYKMVASVCSWVGLMCAFVCCAASSPFHVNMSILVEAKMSPHPLVALD